MHSQPIDARITIREAIDRGYPTDIEGPGGEYPERVIPEEAKNRVCVLREQLEQLPDTARAAAYRTIDMPMIKRMKEIGQYLFKILNADGELVSALNLPGISADQRLRVQLRIRDDELTAWPWELLCDPGQVVQDRELPSQFLALHPRVLLSRYHEQPVAVPQPETVEQLRVLVVVASPTDYDPLGPALREIDSLRLVGDTTKRLELQVLEHATPQSLELHLKQTELPFHVVHFVGHGYFETTEPEGTPRTGVVLEEQDRRGSKVEAQEFARILLESRTDMPPGNNAVKTRGGPYPCLVTICACDSARTTFSVAKALVDYGVPAVIGMHRKVSVPLVILFNKELYNQLIDGYAIDHAVAECRRHLNEFNSNLDWSAPVLYLRAKDGILFDFNAHSGEHAQWLEQLRLYSELVGVQTEEAVHTLLKLGTSAVVLAVATALAYPVAAVRAGAAALLRALPRTPEVHDTIINLVGPAIVSEPEVSVRREMARILAQPGVSPRAALFLRDLILDHDAETRDIARIGLTVPTSSDDFELFIDHIRRQLEQVTTVLNQLSVIVSDSLRQDKDYSTYLQQVEDARNRAMELQRNITQAQQDAVGMTADEVWDNLRPQIRAWVDNANEAIIAANQAAHASHLLVSRLALALDELAGTLGLELSLMRELDEITQGSDGVVISDVQGDASVRIVRRSPGASDAIGNP